MNDPGNSRRLNWRLIAVVAALALLLELGRTWQLVQSDMSQVLAEATSRSVLLGNWVRLQAGNVTVEGIAEALDPAGHLLIRTQDGALRTMSAGEVSSHAMPGVVSRL